MRSVQKNGRVVEAILMLDSHDKNCFVILNKAKVSKGKIIRVPNINQISLDVERGNFQRLVTEEKNNIVSLFLTAESLDFKFNQKEDLDAFLYVLNETVISLNR